VYVGCAEALTGRIENATILKMHREKPQVSFLAYPEFDRDPHPVLEASIVARLREFTVSYKDFSSRDNPPILHRKETFVPDDYPRRDKFERLTSQEEKAGLLDQPTIGTRAGWEEALERAGLALRGHRLVRASGSKNPRELPEAPASSS
jgi:DNA phosphorothioation-associated putative methyltransferase